MDGFFLDRPHRIYKDSLQLIIVQLRIFLLYYDTKLIYLSIEPILQILNFDLDQASNVWYDTLS